MSQKKNDTEELTALPEARLVKGRLSWLLWSVPIAAGLLCAWFVYHDVIARGPTIHIYFHNADGIEPDQTPLKYRGAVLGQVKSLTLETNMETLDVEVSLAGAADNLARAGTVFWIVRPKLGLGQISGLRTIVSGNYLTARPGNGPPTNTFVGAEQPPPEMQLARGLEITLLAPRLSSLQRESPVLYRGITVGKVVGYQLATNAQEVEARVRIRPEYAPLVRKNSKFWNAGGLKINVGLFSGAQISAESPATLISGGVEFATPTEAGEPATNGFVFRLYETPDSSWKDWWPDIKLELPKQAPALNSQSSAGSE